MSKKGNKANKAKAEETEITNPIQEGAEEATAVAVEEDTTAPELGVEPEVEIVTELVEEVVAEQPAAEPEPVKETKKVKKEEKVVSFKEIFEKSLEQTPYMLIQNGIIICRWKPNVIITCHEDGFTLNHTKYSYQGIEVKHL